MKLPDLVEDVSGSKLISAGLAIASIKLPFLSLVPALLTCAAGKRMQSRMEEAFLRVQGDLEKISAKVDEMSDAQYKFVCETISAMQHTVDVEKLAYLRNAIVNGVQSQEVSDTRKSYALSRIVRDIAAEELQFLIVHASSTVIGIMPTLAKEETPEKVEKQKADLLKNGWVLIDETIDVRYILNGLTSLGLIVSAGRWKEGYQLTPLACSLLTLIKAPNNV